jgi:DDE superfamily endonuclease
MSGRSCSRAHRSARLFDGPINGERFHAYVEQFLAPTLKSGDVVILDNLGSHKGKAVRRIVRSASVIDIEVKYPMSTVRSVRPVSPSSLTARL